MRGLALCVALAALSVAGCGGTDTTAVPLSTSTAASAANNVSAAGVAAAPATLTPGETANLKLVQDFCRSWGAADFDPAKVMPTYIAADGRARVMQDQPFIQGPTALAEAFKPYLAHGERFRVKFLDVFARGPLVTTHRIDTVVTPGKPDQNVEVLGVFLLKDGKLAAIECARVEWAPDDQGRMQMREVEGSAFELKADLVLLAMGFVGPRKPGLVEQATVELDPRGNVKANVEDYRTSAPNVFACGDMRRGQSLVVWAIREGRQCARAVDEYLMGATKLPR
jgi:limonene-1,2-epoxide hydrolase